MLHIDIAERRGQQWSRPAGIACWRRLIQQPQNALIGRCGVLWLGAPIAGLVEAA
ncbi:hypothetical protein HZZ13_23210 [Bradyrhizobium sp. CNPSo 4010]|uniref:Uncharacterized protein n=1 Tax=Bradyrhizobium agreste TaxID=2751811 RepID=A0ABS0PUV7_9BRAD|nr:hypothetical protein [Bradyrhizobium agreste]